MQSRSEKDAGSAVKSFNDERLETEGDLQPTTVFIVDADNIIKSALASLLSTFNGFVVGSECSAEDALTKIIDSTPEVLITEIKLGGACGFELIRELSKRSCPTKTVVLSGEDSEEAILKALSIGAVGYILKRCSTEELLDCLNHVRTSNNRYLPSEYSHLHQRLDSGCTEADFLETTDVLCELSPREREIFFLLAKGLQNTVIAKKLFISPRTVETHRARIVRKLGVNSNGELIRFAIKHGLSII
jgi:DNA-binding NarL/FixJ family response regulator